MPGLDRDQFFWELKRAALLDDCQLTFVEEPPEDELTFRVQRAVKSGERHREIEESRGALEARADHDQGHPPYGLTYDDAGEQWIINRESGDFQDALNVVRLRDEQEMSW